MSFGELSALNAAWTERVKREDWRAAVVACAIVNCHRTKEDGPVHPEDVMPWLKENQEPEKKLSVKQTRELFEQLTEEMGGIVHPRNRPLAGG